MTSACSETQTRSLSPMLQCANAPMLSVVPDYISLLSPNIRGDLPRVSLPSTKRYLSDRRHLGRICSTNSLQTLVTSVKEVH